MDLAEVPAVGAVSSAQAVPAVALLERGVADQAGSDSVITSQVLPDFCCNVGLNEIVAERDEWHPFTVDSVLLLLPCL